jgi:cholesterol transport system auxiliary component
MKTALRSVAPLALAALTLAGCISLFPKTKPSQLYRFGAPATTSAPATPAAGSFAVRLAPVGFPVSAAADRILTVNGEQVAYVSGARWVTAAATLFEAAVIQTFDTRGGPARLLARGELAPATLVLKLDVRRFETRYDQGATSAPTVLVEVYAALDNPADATQHRQRIFVERVPATDNRMEPIVAAYDQAVGKVCAEVVDWVNTRGG